LGIGGAGSARVLDIVRKLDGTIYVTGHGARNYLDHEAFERAGVHVEYMQYLKTPYPQLHGAFNPYVSVLDLIANAGRAGLDCIHSQTVGWKEFA
ncbi:MAG: WbqC family protein, partial [Proteobacteria bacterium]|nr:WbqC family protein [Pseudomonadota bacterium]